MERRPLGQGARELLKRAPRPRLVVANCRRSTETGDAGVAAGVGIGRQVGKVVGQAARILAIAYATARRLRAQRGRGKGTSGPQQPAARECRSSIYDSDSLSMTHCGGGAGPIGMENGG